MILEKAITAANEPGRKFLRLTAEQHEALLRAMPAEFHAVYQTPVLSKGEEVTSTATFPRTDGKGAIKWARPGKVVDGVRLVVVASGGDL